MELTPAACPAGCRNCTIPGYNTLVPYDALECTACQDGYVLENRRCVQQCSPGWYLPRSGGSDERACAGEFGRAPHNMHVCAPGAMTLTPSL